LQSVTAGSSRFSLLWKEKDYPLLLAAEAGGNTVKAVLAIPFIFSRWNRDCSSIPFRADKQLVLAIIVE